MSAVYADLLVPDIDPIDAAAAYTATSLRENLGKLSDVARGLGLLEVWAGARLAGLEHSAYVGGPAKSFGDDPVSGPETSIGVSLWPAFLVGVGFCRDAPIDITPPPLPARDASALEQKKYALRRATFDRTAPARVRELDALRRIADGAGDHLPFRVRVAIGATANGFVWGFDDSYRRRLAYGLGFEASLRAGNLTPYVSRQEALVLGSAADLEAVLPETLSTEALSVHLNALAHLDRVLVRAATPDVAEPGATLRVCDGAAKRSMIQDRLGEAIAHRARAVHEDAHIALRALLVELETHRTLGLNENAGFPIWGSLGSTHDYEAPVIGSP